MTVTKAKKGAVKKAAPASNGHKKPGDSGFDWQGEYPGEDVFVFEASDGQTIGLARPVGDRAFRPGDFRAMMHMESWQVPFYTIEKVACPAALAVADQLKDDDFGQMMTQWSEWHKNAGES